jgi:hypothetical protein
MMAFKDGASQIVKLTATRRASIALTMRLMAMSPAFHKIDAVTGGTPNTGWPTQLANDFITFGIIDQGLDVNEHTTHQLKGMTAILPQF